MQNTRSIKKIAGGIAAALVLTLAGTGLALAQSQTPTQLTVSVQSGSFSPAVVSIPQGSTVTWTNNDSVTHNVTASDNSFSSDITAGQSYSHTFNTVGTYSYYDKYYGNTSTGMNGSIEVTSVSSESSSGTSASSTTSTSTTATATSSSSLLPSVYNNPISQWIVLSGLFGGNAFGYNTTNGASAGNTVFNNPISQWIVLSELFGNQNVLQ